MMNKWQVSLKSISIRDIALNAKWVLMDRHQMDGQPKNMMPPLAIVGRGIESNLSL